MRKKFEVCLREVVIDDCGGYYCADCVDLSTGEIVRVGKTFDNLGDALADFAERQHEWYDSLGCCSTTDEWHVTMNVVL